MQRFLLAFLLVNVVRVRGGGVAQGGTSNCPNVPTSQQILNCGCNELTHPCNPGHSVCSKPGISGYKGICQCDPGFSAVNGKCQGTCTISVTKPYVPIECIPNGPLCGAFVIAGSGCVGGLTFTVEIVSDEWSYYYPGTPTFNGLPVLFGVNSTSGMSPYPILLQNQAPYWDFITGDYTMQCVRITATDATGKTASTNFCGAGNVMGDGSGYCIEYVLTNLQYSLSLTQPATSLPNYGFYDWYCSFFNC